MSTPFVVQDFEDRFYTTEKEIPFNSDWHNGTGYFNPAVKLVELTPGEEAKSKDELGRKIIFIGTRFGTCVVFEREASNTQRICSNLPRAVCTLFCIDNRVDDQNFTVLFGRHGGSNIGSRIEELFVSQAAAA